jgi:hypothetical protein
MATTHIVSQGECLASIAHKYGFVDWRPIYERPENSDFRNKRPDPFVIHPGDKIFIPDRKQRVENGETEKRHVFRLKRAKSILRIVLRDEEGRPISSKKYRLKVGDKEYKDTTQQDGLVEKEIPAKAVECELTVWLDDKTNPEGSTWPLQLRHLDPVEEITGVQARLNNLGFDCGPEDGICGVRTEAALRAFQEKHENERLVVNGKPDEQTRAKLKKLHGC